MKILLNKKLFALETEFENEVARAKYEYKDVNTLYEEYALNRDELNSEFKAKITIRLDKAKDEIKSIESAYKLRIKKIKELAKEIKKIIVKLKKNEKIQNLKELLMKLFIEILFLKFKRGQSIDWRVPPRVSKEH
ncbi:hypothetical protein SCLARK_001618 [Spiroplasma clarkii]|nr:hypothetical protein SCLARK_001618 [Spiroplasma clarkii]